jgi:hypothetical protein
MATAVDHVPQHRASRRPLTWRLTGRHQRTAILRAQLHLARGERVLMHDGHRHSPAAVASDRALYWRTSAHGWARASWAQLRLPSEELTTNLSARLLDFAAEQVAATRLVVTRVQVTGHEFVIEGRREPVTDEVRWLVWTPAGFDPDDAQRHAIAAHIAEVRAQLGA